MKILAMTCCCVDIYPETGQIVPGGNALNVAVACSKTKAADIFVMGAIGSDNHAAVIKESLDKFNIDRSRVYELKGQSANHTIYIDAKGDRYFKENSWVNGVWPQYRISDSDKSFMQGMDLIATTFYEPEFRKILEIKKESGFVLSVDFHEEKITDEWAQLLDSIDFLFISGKNQDIAKLKYWSEKFNAVFVATLGENGSLAYHKGKIYKCNAVKADKVIDTTGCGDSYQGTFLIDYFVNKDIARAMQKASEAAAVTLSFFGGF